MSATNSTTHYALPQYVATDHPKYLTDFNETMATIDSQMYTNATAAATADGKAVAAQNTADANTSSIGSLNVQINGDPDDPSDTGLAGDVSGVESDVNTIQSLIGNGSPTTSNQTIIGAINAIEGSIAPAEDSATLGASYATGKQFARGGVVYEALNDLTAGTAFTSLTLNTDYKVADTLTKQISDVVVAISNKESFVGLYTKAVTADGVKTYTQLISELISAVNTDIAAMPADEKLLNPSFEVVGIGFFHNSDSNYWINAGGFIAAGEYSSAFCTANGFGIRTIYTGDSSFRIGVVDGTSGSGSITDNSSVVPTEGTVVDFNAQVYRNLV